MRKGWLTLLALLQSLGSLCRQQRAAVREGVAKVIIEKVADDTEHQTSMDLYSVAVNIGSIENLQNFSRTWSNRRNKAASGGHPLSTRRFFVGSSVQN